MIIIHSTPSQQQICKLSKIRPSYYSQEHRKETQKLVEHNFNNSPPPSQTHVLGTFKSKLYETWQSDILQIDQAINRQSIPFLALSLSKKVFGILNLLTQSRLMNRVRSLCKSIMLQIWGVISSSSSSQAPWSSKYLLTISWLGYHLQYPNDNNTYSQVKAKSNPESKSITNCRLERQ